MGSFAYSQLEIDLVRGIRLRSTEPQVIQVAIDLATQLVPSCKIATESKRVSGELLECRIEKLQGRELAVGWEVLARLGQSGWEAFAADRVSGEPYDQCYHLKLPQG